MAIGLVLNRSRQVPAEDSPAFGGIAERFRRAGELDRAVGLCQEGLSKFPGHLSARVTLGWALLDLGRYEEARQELEQVLKRAPDNLAAIRGLAELHDRTEHDEVAAMQDSSPWQALEPTAPPAPHAAVDEAPYTSPEVILGHGMADELSDLGLLDPPFDPPLHAADPAPASTPDVAGLHSAPHELSFADPEDLTALLPIAPVVARGPWPAAVPSMSEAPAEASLDEGAEDGASQMGSTAVVVAASVSAPPVLPADPSTWSAAYESEFLLEADDPALAEIDDGPGPWPPVIAEDPAPVQATQALAAVADGSAPAAELEPAPKKTLGMLGRLLRRVESRRETSLAEYLAG